MKMMTPLMIACELGRTENVEFLVEQQQKAIKALDKKDEDFELMKSSSDFVGTKGPFGNYPIHYAVRSGNFDTVKALVEGAGEDIDLNVKTTAGESPITLACISGSFEIVEYLLDHNVELHETKKQKKSPLIWAAQNGHIHVVSLLLRHGVHPDVHDSSGNTATHYAAGYGWLNVMKFLIENGAHPDLKNDWNSSPAMIAMLKNHFGCLDYLMELEDVDKSMVDNEGRSVISQLCMNYNPDTLEQIKYMDKFKNLDYCSRDANGWTCLHFLVANSADMYKLQQNIAEREKARKKELEKKLGIKKSNLQPHSIYATKVKHTKRSSKRPAYTSAMEVDGEPEEEQDDDHKELNSIREYFDQSLVKHREMLVEERERFEDGMLECVEHIYSKGLKEDVLSYENESIISIAISSGNFKVAIWMINKLCDGDVPKEVFNNSQSNDNNQNNSCLSFFFDLVNTSQGMKYEPLIHNFKD